MTVFCSYHPTRPALWSCQKCGADLCPACIDKRTVEGYGGKKDHYFCPRCNVYAVKLSVTNIIVPFWKRLPSFFLYPLQSAPVMLMAVLSFASFFFSEFSIFEFLIRFVIWGVMLKYSYSALVATSNGNLKPPKINMATISEDFEIVFKQIGIYFIIGMIYMFVLRLLGFFPAVAFLLAALFFVPAMIIILALTKSLVAAIYPPVFVRMATRVGWPYVLMCFFLILLLGAPAALGRLVGAYLPSPVYFFIMIFAQNYYTLISYHLMGYLMFQYHEEVGHQIIYEGEDPVEKQDRENTEDGGALLNSVDILIKEGKLDEAIELIRRESTLPINDIKLAERFYNLLKIRNMLPLMLEQGKEYLDLLNKEKQAEKMCNVYLECCEKDATFRPNADTLYSVARHLNDRNKPKDAVKAFEDYINSNPGSPLIQNAYFFVARIYNEKLNNSLKASEILKYLTAEFPFHENASFVKQYLSKIDTPLS